MGFKRAATPGCVIASIATILSALVLAGPFLKSTSLFTAGSSRYGPLGYCGTNGCVGASVGYDNDINIPKWLTYALVLNIVTLILAFLAAFTGCLAHRREWSTTPLTSGVSGFASIIALLAFIFDLAIFLVGKSRSSVGAAPGAGLWLALSTAILLVVGTGCAFIGRKAAFRRQARRNPDLGRMDSKSEKKTKIATLKSKKGKYKQPTDVQLPNPAAAEADNLNPAQGDAHQLTPSSPAVVPAWRQPRTEGGLPAFPERTQQREGGLPIFGERSAGAGPENGLPSFPEMVHEQETSDPPQHARVVGNEVIYEHKKSPSRKTTASSGSPIIANNMPNQQQAYQQQPNRSPQIPEQIMPRRQGSTPTTAPQGPYDQQGTNGPVYPMFNAPAFPPSMPQPAVAFAYGSGSPSMPQAAHPSPHRQPSDPASISYGYAQSPYSPPPVRPGPSSAWPTQTTMYYTPGDSFHQQHPSAPAAYGHTPQGSSYQPPGRAQSEYNPYFDLQQAHATRSSYYTPPEFISDPYNPQGLTMPAGYQGAFNAGADHGRSSTPVGAEPLLNRPATTPPSRLPTPTNPHMSTYLGDTKVAPTTSPSSPPPLPPKPGTSHMPEAPSTWSLPNSAGSGAPSPLPAKPGSPDSMQTNVKHDGIDARVQHTVRSPRSDEEALPAYEEPIAGPSGTHE